MNLKKKQNKTKNWSWKIYITHCHFCNILLVISLFLIPNGVNIMRQKSLEITLDYYNSYQSVLSEDSPYILRKH